MNPPPLPPQPSSSTTPPPPPRPRHTTGQFLAIVAAAAALTWLADILFWNKAPGASTGIYFCAMAAVIIQQRWRKWSGVKIWIAAALMLAAACASAIELSFTNTAVLAALLAVIIGECWYGELPAGPARWLEPLVSWIAAPGRWFWLACVWLTIPWKNSGLHMPQRDNFFRTFQILAPAAIITPVFAITFGYGNAVFGELINRVAVTISRWILGIDLSLPRLFFWLAVCTFALAIVHPRRAPGKPRFWARRFGLFHRGDITVAVLQSALLLFALNALFFVVNTIDVFYLWHHAKLPSGVNLSQFVHEGVYSLVLAVLLSAVVMAAIFQQHSAVKKAGLLKSLALLWIAQNLVLIAGVFLRLKLYVDSYQLTEQRVYVGCFLLLVAAGFALLSWHVLREGDLNTLIFRCVVATFLLFFALQFPDVAGRVAHYNVARWVREPGRALDVGYIESLGPDAWPALLEIANSPRPCAERIHARDYLAETTAREQHRTDSPDWRSWQFRHQSRLRQLLAQAKNFEPAPTGLP